MRDLLRETRHALARKVCLDRHDPRGTTLLTGTGRGGTTWLAQLINHDHSHRLMFEPVMPDRVPMFTDLSRRPYLKRGDTDDAWADAMDRVVAGRVRNAWIDAHNTKLVTNRRLIKDIRLNLALPWLAERYPAVPIVWALRHPCAVAHSKIKLGWDTHLDLFLDDDRLMADHLAPFRSLLSSATEAWERHILMWCVETLVPRLTLRPGEAIPVYYEDICDRPWEEMDRLFAYLGRPVTPPAMERAFAARSPHYRRDSAVVTGGDPVASWEKHVTPAQRRRAGELLAAFGLDAVYRADDPRPRCSAEGVIGTRAQAG